MRTAALPTLVALLGLGVACSGTASDSSGSPPVPSSIGSGGFASSAGGSVGLSGGANSAAGAGGAPTASGCTNEDAFTLLQQKIFDGHNCSVSACHGDAASGGLVLTSGRAHDNLVNAAAKNSDKPRVTPGRSAGSFLFEKLKAATSPGTVNIAGSPMPVGGDPLTASEIAAVAAWIDAGAPAAGAASAADGTVAALLGCGSGGGPNGGDAGASPPPVTGDTAELVAPSPDKGIQFTMPGHPMLAGTEWEGCYASYYDYTDRVPNEYKSPDGAHFYVDSTEIHQTQGSHHLVIMNTALTTADLSDASLGKWTCKGGSTDGAECDPQRPEACPGAICGSEPKATVACIGYGPSSANVNAAGFGLGTALQSQVKVAALPGVYRKVPLKGVIFWDLHAFNLTADHHVQHANLNLTYAADRRFFEQRMTVMGNLGGVPPFTRKDLCSKWVTPKGTKILRLTSHSHSRGENFRVWDPSGKRIYQSLVYNDPAYITFEPPLEFNSEKDAERTLTFCNVYNNGLKPNGGYDLEKVIRLSKVPPYDVFKPTPTACAAGQVGAPCIFALGDRPCDTSFGKGDGSCDAAPISLGETTASEMFFMLPDVVNSKGEEGSGTDFGSTYVFGQGLPPQDVRE